MKSEAWIRKRYQHRSEQIKDIEEYIHTNVKIYTFLELLTLLNKELEEVLRDE